MGVAWASSSRRRVVPSAVAAAIPPAGAAWGRVCDQRTPAPSPSPRSGVSPVVTPCRTGVLLSPQLAALGRVHVAVLAGQSSVTVIQPVRTSRPRSA